MAKVASKKMWWDTVADAASYPIRFFPQGATFSYDQAAALDPAQVTGQPQQEVDLHGVQLAEGVYDVYITAKDAAGNESDPLELAGSVLDFTPPSAPTSGGFR